MDDRKPNDFVSWMVRQKGRNDPIADLANAMARDQDLPRSFATVDDLYSYMKPYDGAVIAALFAALEEWSGCELPKHILEDWSAEYEGMTTGEFMRVTVGYAFQPKPKRLIDDGTPHYPGLLGRRMGQQRKPYRV